MGRQSNTARRRAQAQTAREKAAAIRAASQRRERRRRLMVIGGSTIAVLAIIGGIVAAGVLSGKSTNSGASSRRAAPAAVVSAVSGVPSSTLAAVGKGAIAVAPKSVHDSPLTANGKPQVLFVGAEYCPYCAAERWPMVQALSRFGSFSGLKLIHSSASDVYPNTATFSFYGASYQSSTLAFTGKELETVTGARLESPTSAEAKLWHRYTGNRGSFPFLDVGGRYVVTGPSYDPAVLKGLTAQQIASRLADPTSDVAKAVDGTANVLTAAICAVTGNQPAAVCSAPGVTAAAKALSG